MPEAANTSCVRAEDADWSDEMRLGEIDRAVEGEQGRAEKITVSGA